ncbi:MAG: type VI secretion system accessory protein TagJ [Mariniblastus sp.]
MIDELVQLFNQGKLTEAIARANAAVAKDPRDIALRLVLVQLVCFTGNWERVEKVAKQLEALDSEREHMALTNFIDKLSIAEIQRKAVWESGMVPEFVETPDEVTKKLLWAWSCLRSGDKAQYQETLDWVLENAPLLTMEINGKPHEGFRDLDDPTCTVFEAHTVQGVYLWIPHYLVKKIEIAKPTRLVDHLWSKTRITLRDDTDLAVYIPGLYFHSFDEGVSESIQLGRETQWIDSNEVEIGLGRRIFGAGEEEFTLFDFEDVTLSGDAPVATQESADGSGENV